MSRVFDFTPDRERAYRAWEAAQQNYADTHGRAWLKHGVAEIGISRDEFERRRALAAEEPEVIDARGKRDQSLAAWKRAAGIIGEEVKA